VGDDVGVFVLVGGEEEAEGEAAGVGVGVCVGDVLGMGLVRFSVGVGGLGLKAYWDASGGGKAGEDGSALGCEVRCAGEGGGFGCWVESTA
jgi:hypothetical protein